MNRIDRYILSSFWGNFVAGLLVFVTVLAAVDALSMMVQYQGVSGAAYLKYYSFYLPEIVYRMLPVSCLMATLLTIANLQKGSELVALFSIGMSLFRVCIPILASVMVVCAASLVISDQVLPKLAKNKNFVFYSEIRKNPSLYSTVKTDRIWYRSKDLIFNIKTLNEKQQRAQGLSLYYFNPAWDLIQMITAEEVEMEGTKWNLKKGSLTLFTEDSSFPLTTRFDKKVILMGEDAKDLSSTANTSDILSLAELSQFIQKNKEAGLDTIKYEVDYHAKYGFALAGLIMSLLGLPFSVAKARSGGLMANVGMCLGVVLGYWILYSSSITLGNYGHISPVLAGWGPNFFCGLVAIIGFRRLRL